MADDQPTTPRHLLAAATGHLDRLAELHRSLAEVPFDPTVERTLAHELVLRDGHLRQLGALVLHALASGASVEALAHALTPSATAAPQASGPTDEDEPPASEPDEAPASEDEPPAHEPDEAPADEPDEGHKPAPVASLLALAQRGIGGARPEAKTPPPAFDPRPLRDLLNALGPQQPLSSKEATDELLGQLEHTINNIDTWQAFPKDIQRDLLGLCSSLARHLQDESPYPPSDRDLRPLFRAMTRYSADKRPGFVPGLSRSNPPDRDSWLSDAQRWHAALMNELLPAEAAQPLTPETALSRLEAAMAQGFDDGDALAELVQHAVAAGLSQSDKRLVELLTPHQSVLRGTPGLKTLKGHLKRALDDQDDFERVQDAASPLPEDWPHRHLTEGKVGVILGGDTRPAALQRLKSAFGFKELTWEGAEPRRTEAVAERIEQGSVDVVILLLRFIQHSHTDVLVPACKGTGVPLVQVKTGYGVDAVRRAIDKLPEALLQRATS